MERWKTCGEIARREYFARSLRYARRAWGSFPGIKKLKGTDFKTLKYLTAFQPQFTNAVESWWGSWTEFLASTGPVPPLFAFVLSCALGWLITGRIQRLRETWRKR